MALTEFESLLKETIGLDAASIGSSSIERAVLQRLSVWNLKDPRIYLQILRASENELQELIEEVVVPETWFFRDHEAFTALARIAREEWPRSHPQGVLRLLSLPCATGEEPYSMAMALCDGGFPMDRFRVDGLDISERALAEARRGIYRENSFRGKELGFRARYFNETAAGYQLTDIMREQVRFQQGNLFASDFLPGHEVYDVIFCRNVLIYFDGPSQGRAIDVLRRLLAPKALLFVGPSETALFLKGAFVSEKTPLAFGFRKTPPAVELDSGLAPLSRRLLPAYEKAAPVRARKPIRTLAEKPAAAPLQKVMVAAKPKVWLGEVMRLANKGCLSEAATLCEERLQTDGPSADAFHLLGMVRDAVDNATEAAACYRKALYLDPNHKEALVHLILSLEKQGKDAEARVLRNRVSRLNEGSRKLHG